MSVIVLLLPHIILTALIMTSNFTTLAVVKQGRLLQKDGTNYLYVCFMAIKYLIMGLSNMIRLFMDTATNISACQVAMFILVSSGVSAIAGFFLSTVDLLLMFKNFWNNHGWKSPTRARWVHYNFDYFIFQLKISVTEFTLVMAYMFFLKAHHRFSLYSMPTSFLQEI